MILVGMVYHTSCRFQSGYTYTIHQTSPFSHCWNSHSKKEPHLVIDHWLTKSTPKLPHQLNQQRNLSQVRSQLESRFRPSSLLYTEFGKSTKGLRHVRERFTILHQNPLPRKGYVLLMKGSRLEDLTFFLGLFWLLIIFLEKYLLILTTTNNFFFL